MITGSVLLWCVGVLAALVGLCWVVSFFQRNLPSEKFDERQKQVRDKANSLAMDFGYAYYLVLFAAMELGWELPLDAATLVILGILMQAMILHIYALLHNAELPLGQKPGAAVISYVFSGFTHMWIFRNRMEYLKIAELAQQKGVDMLGIPMESAREDVYLFLIFAVISFSMAAMHLIRLLWREKEE